MNLLISWTSLTLAFWAASKLLPGFDIKGGAGAHVLVAALFGTLSFFLGSALFVAIGVVTLGIGFLLSFVTRLVVTTILLVVTAKFSRRLHIKDFNTAFLASLVMAVIGTGTEALLHRLS